ncbi:deoxycytidylate deaminase [Sulfurimonas sp. NW7]|uniref:deoxycytidylate deaminase n=1 Tax=Sulfurimonas sp. NW7 TaxID=2922727 RepID=UPI003DA92627
MVEAINQIYKHRQDFILIGLTGKIGAGCTTTADFLSKDISEHNLPDICITDKSTDDDRKRYIVQKFYNKNWKPFIKIIASDVITSFLLENDFQTVQAFLSNKGLKQFDLTFEEEYQKLSDKLQSLNFEFRKNTDNFHYVTTTLPDVSQQIKEALGIDEDYDNYAKAYQIFGDNIRQFGSAVDENNPDAKNIYTISTRINQFIKIIHSKNKDDENPTYIVIDAFRNPFEVMFFKERYSAFYLMGIHAEQKHIEDRLSRKSNMNPKDIEKMHKKETSKDTVDKETSFVSQNIPVCIQKSDIYISNNGLYGEAIGHEFYGQVIKFISLIQHPGLITPSLDEKMMQIAHTAKLNSACLSRQVGACITNENGSLKGIGWNSVAEGQTPCLLRSTDELLQGTKSSSYSEYEKSEKFTTSLVDFQKHINVDNLKGRNVSFCFSEIHNKYANKESNGEQDCKCDKNQVHTRSLHAEENAFLQIAKYGGEGIKNGTLYSTASPCELCSKKAYQLGIKKVVYIDLYPGIAQSQILNTGLYPPKVVLFKGAIGTAYHKLYDPILSYKDELNALSINAEKE